MRLRTETAEQFAHRTNIERYQKILATYLTTEERRFVERRLAEEQVALQQLAWKAAPEAQSICRLPRNQKQIEGGYCG
jgi:hypothetical protein